VSQPYQAILLIAFGGPTSRGEIRPFLARVTKGTAIPPERLEEVAHHYEAVGSKSPLNEITFRQAAALRKVLAEAKMNVPVYVGMRNSRPFFKETLKQMIDDGVKRALGFILSSHRTEASWERYQKNIADARAELGDDAPTVDFCDGWHDHPLFIQSWKERIEAVIDHIAPGERDAAALIFTAHSLPVAMAAKSAYVEQLESTTRLIAEKLGSAHWSLAYQSRSGRSSDPWLEPDIRTAIQRWANQGCKDVVIAPIGFVSDHVEILYDLDIESKEIAEDLGLRFYRVSCPNDHSTFILMMADVIAQKMKRAEDRG
jgi:protoporphyrin/coproporphyrin ferrochelatase